MDECANLTASIGRVHLYPSNGFLTRGDCYITITSASGRRRLNVDLQAVLTYQRDGTEVFSDIDNIT